MNIQQRMAQKAFEKAGSRSNGPQFEEYCSFARGFPSLLHTCGLVQAVTFANAAKDSQKYKKDLVDDLKEILAVGGMVFSPAEGNDLADMARKADQQRYLILGRRCLQAAIWLKRYAEALKPEKKKD